MRTASLFAACIAASLVNAPLLAQAPDSVSFQGYVTNAGGDPINSAGLSMTFKLYENGTEIWSETQPSVIVADGLFNVLLGSVTPLDTVRFNRPLELGIKVGADPEIVPRTPLAAAAYAKALPGMYTVYAQQSLQRGYNVVGGGPNNVIGSGVIGAVIGGGGGVNSAGFPSGNSALADVSVVAGGTDNVASGYASTISGGDFNVASGQVATVAGGRGNRAKAHGSFAAGLRAKASHIGSFVWHDGVSFDTLRSTASYQFLIGAAGGVGIGVNDPTADLDVYGGIRARGVTLLFHGTSEFGSSNLDDGVRFRYDGDFGGGSSDYLLIEKTDGVQNAPDGGIAFVNTGADGVVETALRIYGSGSVEIPGNLTKGSGSFKIDHPLDPTNKYLYHSFVESPDMKNVYDGVVVLNENGEAEVQLPTYFEALNSDFRYQLTCIGGFAPVYVAEKIAGNRFHIAGGAPGMEVSWMVTGIRRDPYAAQHPIEVEVDKQTAERGTYLHPEAYGASR